MTNMNQIITEHLDIWTSAIEKKSSAGRGKGRAISLYGIKKLRKLILELAVRGKLVEQDENAEKISSLMVRLSKNKEHLISKGIIKKPRIFNAELTKPRHPVPECWQWVRLDAIGAIVGGGTPSTNKASNFEEPNKGIAWLTPADLSKFSDVYIERGARDLSSAGLSNSSATLMPKDTVLFTSRAPIGYVAISAGQIATNQGFKSIVPFEPKMARFIAIVLQCFAPEIDASGSGTTFKEVSGKIVASISFPLPPTAEQHRIVAKVDELMGLCDNLSSKIVEQQNVKKNLVDTLVKVS